MPNLVAIYGPPDEPRVDEQLARLSGATSAARQRDVGYLEVRRQPQAATFRDLAGLDEQTFAVLLIRDSDEAARWGHVVAPDDIRRAFGAGWCGWGTSGPRPLARARWSRRMTSGAPSTRADATGSLLGPAILSAEYGDVRHVQHSSDSPDFGDSDDALGQEW